MQVNKTFDLKFSINFRFKLLIYVWVCTDSLSPVFANCPSVLKIFITSIISIVGFQRLSLYSYILKMLNSPFQNKRTKGGDQSKSWSTEKGPKVIKIWLSWCVRPFLKRGRAKTTCSSVSSILFSSFETLNTPPLFLECVAYHRYRNSSLPVKTYIFSIEETDAHSFLLFFCRQEQIINRINWNQHKLSPAHDFWCTLL